MVSAAHAATLLEGVFVISSVQCEASKYDGAAGVGLQKDLSAGFEPVQTCAVALVDDHFGAARVDQISDLTAEKLLVADRACERVGPFFTQERDILGAQYDV